MSADPLDARSWTQQHLQSQTHRRASQIWAVGDNNNSHHVRLSACELGGKRVEE